MVKAEVKTPNKRKSVANETPSKKIKVENGKSSEKPFTPKKPNQSPKNNQQGSAQKLNKKNKQGMAESPKAIKPFAGTKQLNQGKKPKIEQPHTGANGQSQEHKKKRRNQFEKLITTVRSKQGSKDAEILKQLNDRIQAIKSRGELTKTAKRKLALLQKLKVICEEGSAAASAKSKEKVEVEKAAASKVKADKKAAAPQAQAAQPKKKQAVKAAPVKQEVKEEDSDEDSDVEGEEEDSDEEAEGEEDSDEVEAEDSDEVEGEDDEEDDDDDEEEGDDGDDDDDDSDEEAVPAVLKPKVSNKKPQPNKKK